MHALDTVEAAMMRDTILLITGWILVVASTAVLLRYRLLLRHCDRQVLRWDPEHPNSLHAALQSRMTRIDRWGVSLTIAIVVYAGLFVMFSLYQSFARVGHAILELLSYI
jgi:hypothetical protein